VTSPNLTEDIVKADRSERFTSHALVEIRRFRWLMFWTESAVLLDMSAEGFKLEFTGEASAKPGTVYWLEIPLSPLGIRAPAQLTCRAECKWFDEKRFRVGGVFLDLTASDRAIIQQVVEALRARGYATL
jgi:hypothetical protein